MSKSKYRTVSVVKFHITSFRTTQQRPKAKNYNYPRPKLAPCRTMMNLLLSPSSLLQVSICWYRFTYTNTNPRRPAGMRPSSPDFMSWRTTTSRISLTYTFINHQVLMQDSQIKISKFFDDCSISIEANGLRRTKHCWQNYVDYHKCILAKGEDFAPCRQVLRFTSSDRPTYYL